MTYKGFNRNETSWSEVAKKKHVLCFKLLRVVCKYCNATGVDYWNNNLQWKGFILQDEQRYVNRVILLASLAWKDGAHPTPLIFAFKKNTLFYTEGYLLYNSCARLLKVFYILICKRIKIWQGE